MSEHLELGRSLRDEGMAKAEESTNEWWRSCGLRAIEAAAKTGQVFQAFDLVERYGLEEPANPKAQWGPLLAAARRAGLIVPAGWGESKRPTAHASGVKLWRGAA